MSVDLNRRTPNPIEDVFCPECGADIENPVTNREGFLLCFKCNRKCRPRF